MNKTTTIKDFAKKMYISITSMSRTNRNAPDVNADTNRAVMALSAEFNFSLCKLAQSIKQKHIHNIVVIFPNLSYVLSTIRKGIEGVAFQAGYKVMLCHSNEYFVQKIVYIIRLLDNHFNGFIISIFSKTKVLNRVTAFLQAPSLIIDNEDGGYRATENQIEKKYKRIDILAGPKNYGIHNLL